jgi:hypothetical protein
MALFDPEDEPQEMAREDKLGELINARHAAAAADIKQGRMSTVRAVAELAGMGDGETSLCCDEDEAEALVRAAVVGRSALVGARIVSIVQWAIYQHIMPLAEQDLADMERSRRESADEARIERAIDNRAN